MILLVGPPPDASPAPRGLTLILGQSNAQGQGVVADVDPTWADPYLAVHLNTKLANNISDPPTFSTYDNSLAPHPNFGAELSLGREIPDRDIAVCAIGGSSLAVNWNPYGSYPAAGPNLYHLAVQFAHGIEAARGTEVTTILWFQGESDTTTQAWADAYYANLVQLATLLLAEFPCAHFLYYRLKTPGTFVTTVRAAQDQFAADAMPFTAMVDVTSIPTIGQHFTSQGYLDLGVLFAGVIEGLTPRCSP